MKKFIALVVVLCVVMISSTVSAAANWKRIYSDEYMIVYVDCTSIRYDSNYSGQVFRAFLKLIYSDAGRQKEIEKWRSSGFVPRGVYNLSSSKSLIYFKAENSLKYFDSINGNFYTHDGDIIPEMGFSKNVLKWTIIPPETIVEIIFDKVYMYAQFPAFSLIPD